MAAITRPAPEVREGMSLPAVRRIDEMLSRYIAEGELAGAAFLIARHGKTVHGAVLGLKDLARREPLADDTIYRIYSMTKPVTAVAMMILYDQGLWSPADPIARRLPEFAGVKGPGGEPPEREPTLLDLMTHTAGFAYGIPAEPIDPADKAYIEAGVWKAADLADFSRRVAALPLAYQPGRAWRYSLSMDLQGALIERLTGESLPDFMRTRIFEPLGMVDTGFFVPQAKLPRLATLYHRYNVPELTVLDRPPFVRDPRVTPQIPSGGGGLYSTLDDYARFAQMLANKGSLDGARVISEAAVALMTSNHLPQAIIDAGVVAGTQRICPGRGFGFNGAVFYDPALAGSRVGRGTYQWDGASGVWFWVDPENDLIFVGMIQRMLQDGMPMLQELTQTLVAEALAA
ncbi:MAG TPA: serine hydrolase domain-containing protein [Caulobacteraceae bacterium]|nr:serine hydrolase domain-containing protein [Caulobacteraceae bacterium]